MNESTRARPDAPLARSTAVMAALVGVPILGFLLAPLFRPAPNGFVEVAKVADFAVGVTKLVSIRDPIRWRGGRANRGDRAVGSRARPRDRKCSDLQHHCTHLAVGELQAEAKIFLCPCHGGVYYADGTSPEARRRDRSSSASGRSGRHLARSASAASDGGRRLECNPFAVARPARGRIEERFEFEDSVLSVLGIPSRASSSEGRGWYVFGSATLAVFIMQVATGVGLAMTYVPAPNSAYDSLQFISHDATFGSLFVACTTSRRRDGRARPRDMTQVYLFGAFKYPREANGCPDRSCSRDARDGIHGPARAMDQDAFWSIVVAADRPRRRRLSRHWLASLVVAGANVGGAPLTRFYATHVF